MDDNSIIKALREKKDLSVSDLADAAGLVSGVVYQLENGKRNFRGIYAETAVKIARQLDTTVSYIIDHTPEKERKNKTRDTPRAEKEYPKVSVQRKETPNPIRNLRAENEMSVNQLADMTGTAAYYIYQLENGTRSFRGIAAETANKIAQALRTTVEYIIDNTPEKPPKMKRTRDLSGQRFGKWLVLRRDTEIAKRPYWICQCDCGNIKSIEGLSLKRGLSTSCGCSRKAKEKAENTEHKTAAEKHLTSRRSLVGNVYGDIKVIEYIGDKRYKCQCIKCGDITKKYSSNLKGELGCKVCGKGFRVDLTGNKYGYLTVEKYNKSTKKWLCRCKCGKTIEVKSNNLKHGNTLSCGKCKYIDLAQRFIVGGTRISQIVRKQKNNTSGVTGVGFNKRKGKWYAAIRFRGKKYWLGYHLFKEDAIKIRKLAEEKLYGDFWAWYNEEYKGGSSGQK